ncbi:hypothetical protein [Nocardioides sp.]|uniref:hypothetical protein n=1 Tax=Nocardioides sp. TaxID=35761 RepID=UPI003562176F
MTRAAVTCLLGAALLLLGGCSSGETGETGEGSSDTGGATASTTAIRAGLVELVVGARATRAERADARCFADALLARTTPDQLRSAGVLDASYDVVDELPILSRDDAGTWVDAQFSCADFVDQSARAQEQLSHGAIDRARYAQCLREALTTEQLRAAVVDTLSGAWDGPALARFSAAQADCQRRAAPTS